MNVYEIEMVDVDVLGVVDRNSVGGEDGKDVEDVRNIFTQEADYRAFQSPCNQKLIHQYLSETLQF